VEKYGIAGLIVADNTVHELSVPDTKGYTYTYFLCRIPKVAYTYFLCRIPKVADTHSEYVIFIVCPPQQRLFEVALMFRVPAHWPVLLLYLERMWLCFIRAKHFWKEICVEKLNVRFICIPFFAVYEVI